MNMEDVIARINQLAQKKKTEGLSDQEMEEQNNLRKRYIANIKGSLKSHLDAIKIVDPPNKEDKITE